MSTPKNTGDDKRTAEHDTPETEPATREKTQEVEADQVKTGLIPEPDQPEDGEIDPDDDHTEGTDSR